MSTAVSQGMHGKKFDLKQLAACALPPRSTSRSPEWDRLNGQGRYPGL
ncbi:hypothetical protein [Limnobacter parvus]|nr:hypothetical protein [Limnobacter parvus]